MNYNIEFTDTLSEDIEEKMRKDLVEYESSHGIDVNYKKFALVLKDESGNVLGVLNAFTAFSEIYVDDMWVDNSYRGKGYGRKLLQELEKHFEGKGFNNINLVTSAFNAPEFYKKCGFSVEFIRENKINPKLTKTFFIKYFKNEHQKQGILKKLMSKKITIRLYNNEADAAFLAAIYFNTIHKINAKDYSPEQLDAWAPTSSLEREGWMRKWEKLPPIVAEIDNEIVGFAELEDNGHIDCFYCHHEYQGCGIGSALMKEIEDRARKNKLNKLFAEVSITARPFF